MPDTADQGYPSETEVSARSLRDLNSRIKLLELYALHVLPRNEQWQYAEEFVSNNDILDADMKESFLQILDGLEKESNERGYFIEPTATATKIGEQKMEVANNSTSDSGNPKPESKKIHNQKGNVENDYGIEDISKPSTTDAVIHDIRDKSLRGLSKSSPQYRRSAVRKSSAFKEITSAGHALLVLLQRMSHIIATSLPKQPIPLIRFAMFILGIVLALSRRNVRQKVKSLGERGWERLGRTAGMGVKVSYL